VSYAWVVGEWGRCEAACPAVQSRQVVCRANTGACAAVGMCAGVPRPATTQPCAIGACKLQAIATIAKAQMLLAALLLRG
jgi:hypothetical protein